MKFCSYGMQTIIENTSFLHVGVKKCLVLVAYVSIWISRVYTYVKFSRFSFKRTFLFVALLCCRSTENVILFLGYRMSNIRFSNKVGMKSGRTHDSAPINLEINMCPFVNHSYKYSSNCKILVFVLNVHAPKASTSLKHSTIKFQNFIYKHQIGW
jgi:hypothetical protein